jgi:hypothetical protein
VPVAVLRGVPLLVTDDAFGVVPMIPIIATAVEGFGVLSYAHAQMSLPPTRYRDAIIPETNVPQFQRDSNLSIIGDESNQ